MNDRFKFRVFYKPEKEMIYDAQATYDNACKGQGSFYHWSFQEVLDDDDCIVMQCTGLKDKNGKLIFEGDIVKINDYNRPIEVRFKGLGFELYRSPDNLVGYHNDKYFPESIEVIGNIYEDKDLLDE